MTSSPFIANKAIATTVKLSLNFSTLCNAPHSPNKPLNRQPPMPGSMVLVERA